MKKKISIILLLSLLLSGCAGNKESISIPETDETTAAETTEDTVAETEIPDNLPDMDYEGSECRVMVYDSPDHSYDMVTAGEENGDIMNDSVYRRNRAVEERYNIVYALETGKEEAVVHNSIIAGEDRFEMLFWVGFVSINLGRKGDLLSTSDLPYVDLEKPWWDASLWEGLSINGELLLLSGDISPAGLYYSSAMLFNKNLFDDIGLEYPYDMVKEGTWTIDALSALNNDQTVDLNGDGIISTDDDRFGLSCWMWSLPNAIYYGAGGMVVTKDSEGTPLLTIDMDKMVSVVEKTYKLLYDQNAFFAINSAAEYQKTFSVFADDRSLFLDATLLTLNSLRDMESDFGILPYPKYDEAQNSYYTFVNNATNMVSVPITVPDPERTSILLEAMSSESYKNLTPAFKESVLKGKMSRDEQSGEMVDIIIRTRVFDIAYMYDIPGHDDIIRPLMMNKQTDVVSQLARYTQQAEKALAELSNLFE